MTETEIITSIRGLKEIKPDQEWVFLSKSRILGVETANTGFRFPDYFRFLTYKPALAAAACFAFIIGTVAMAKDSLPGDFLFPVKRIVERSQEALVPKDKLANYQFEQTTKRFNELTTVTEKKQTRNIDSAVSELKASLSQSAKNIKISDNTNKKDIVNEAKKLVEQKDKAEKALGVVINDDGELENAIKTLVDREIEDLDGRTMTDAQAQLLESAKQDVEEGNYGKALDGIWLISNQPVQEDKTSVPASTTEDPSNQEAVQKDVAQQDEVQQETK